jgi:hypothetical protein
MLELDYCRRAERRSVDLPCELVRSDCDEPLGHRLTDMSAYGAWVRTSLPMDIGDGLVLVVTMPDAGEVILFGEVVRRARRGMPQGMGVEFVGLSRHERARLLMSLRGLDQRHVSRRCFARLA